MRMGAETTRTRAVVHMDCTSASPERWAWKGRLPVAHGIASLVYAVANNTETLFPTRKRWEPHPGLSSDLYTCASTLTHIRVHVYTHKWLEKCPGKETFLDPRCRTFCLLPTPPNPFMILTWVWNLKPWGYQKYTFPGICACIVAIVGAVGREDISHREDEAQQPGHEDSQDDLEWSRAESWLGNTSLPACTHHPKAVIARTMQNTCFNETALRGLCRWIHFLLPRSG